MGISNMEVKRMNRNSVFRYMLREGEGSKSSVAAALNLSIPTVAQSFKELQKAGLIQEAGTMESIGGRKAMNYRCVNDLKVAIGVDITRNHVNIVVIDLSMNPLYLKRINIKLHDNQESYNKLKTIIDDTIIKSGINIENILGLGISLPAIVDETGTKLYGMHEEMEITYDIYNIVKQWYPFPVKLGNDADSAGRAEMALSGIKDNTIYFFVSPSVGGSIVIDGKIQYGISRRAGEFGHMTLVPGGRQCYCGRTGCVNSYCTTELLTAQTGGNMKEYFSLLKAGEEKCKEVWDEYLDYLALAIHNLMTSFDMKIVIGGYLGQYIVDYIPQIEERVGNIDRYLKGAEFIQPANLKYEASAVGAAAEFTERYIGEI